MFEQLLQKENLLIIAGVTCLVIWYYRKELSKSAFAQKVFEWLPVAGGLAFGLNTLITLTN